MAAGDRHDGRDFQTLDEISTMNYDQICVICSRCIPLGTEYLEKRFMATQTDFPGREDVSTQTEISGLADSKSVNAVQGDPCMLEPGPYSPLQDMVTPSRRYKQNSELDAASSDPSSSINEAGQILSTIPEGMMTSGNNPPNIFERLGRYMYEHERAEPVEQNEPTSYHSMSGNESKLTSASSGISVKAEIFPKSQNETKDINEDHTSGDRDTEQHVNLITLSSKNKSHSFTSVRTVKGRGSSQNRGVLKAMDSESSQMSAGRDTGSKDPAKIVVSTGELFVKEWADQIGESDLPVVSRDANRTFDSNTSFSDRELQPLKPGELMESISKPSVNKLTGGVDCRQLSNAVDEIPDDNNPANNKELLLSGEGNGEMMDIETFCQTSTRKGKKRKRRSRGQTLLAAKDGDTVDDSSSSTTDEVASNQDATPHGNVNPNIPLQISCRSPVSCIRPKRIQGQLQCINCGVIFCSKQYLSIDAKSPIVTDSYLCELCQTGQSDSESHPDTCSEQELYLKRKFTAAASLPEVAEGMDGCVTQVKGETTVDTNILVDELESGDEEYGNQDASFDSDASDEITEGQLTASPVDGEQSVGIDALTPMSEARTRMSCPTSAPRKKRGASFPCEICGTVFHSKQTLSLHTQIHTDRDVQLWICSRCGLSFRKREAFVKHKKLHSDSDPYVCGVCGTGFVQLHHLDNHSETHAPDDRATCFLHLGSAVEAKRMKPQVEKKDEAVDVVSKSHECAICWKLYATKDGLASHMRMHRNKLVCEQCGKIFYQKNRLRDHMANHEDVRAYECATCGKKFNSAYILQGHMASHTDSRPYPCSTCGKAFKRSSALSRHKLSHQRPFMCDTCGKTFARQCYLDDHSSTHTDTKPYACAECGRGFSWKDNLGAHMKLFHPDQGK